MESNVTLLIDTLLDELSAMAKQPNTEAKTFFDKIVVTTESIFDPQYVAVLARGPANDNLLVHGSKSLIGKLAIPEMAANSEFSQCLNSESQPTVCVLESKSAKCIVTKIQVENRTWGGLVVRFDKSATVEPLTPIFDAIGEITAQFILTRTQQRHAEFLQNFLRFSLNSHSSLQPNRVASHLANDARLMLNCERLSVFNVSRNRAKLLAVSSVSSFENRSMLAKKMIRLVNAACRYQQPFFGEQPPPEKAIREPLEAFQEASGFPFVVGIPLIKQSNHASASKPTLIGYLVAESDDDINRFEFSRNLQLTAPQMGLALSNAQDVARIPFRSTLSAFGKLRDAASLPGLLTLAVLMLAGVWSLFFLETDFRVRINGELRPDVERAVFSPAEGFVESVLVNHGDSVTEDQVLMELSSPTLNLEMEQLAGDQIKTEKLLETKRIALNQAASGNLGDQTTLGKLASEISELEQEQASLDDKKKFLQERITELVILSPINGRVTTWQLKRNILKKPVRWGEGLVKIADESGDWKLNFKVPEYRIGYLLEAREHSNEPLEIEFFFESNPSQKMKTKVLEIAETTELDPEFGPVVTVVCEVPIDEDVSFAKRHGARVIADVTCGKRPVFATWTQELTDSIRRKLVW